VSGLGQKEFAGAIRGAVTGMTLFRREKLINTDKYLQQRKI